MVDDVIVELLRKMWPIYRAGIARHFAAHLTEAEARDFARLLKKVAAAGEQTCEKAKKLAP